MEIRFEKAAQLKPKPADESKLGFGSIFTDYMFVMDYTDEKGWQDARIVPYGPFLIEPSAMVLHYSQETFEGMKAYRTKDGEIQLFRPLENFKRLNRSNTRMCLPQLDEDMALEGLKALLKVEKDWVPKSEGTSLYIRPMMIGMDPFLGLRPSHHNRFIIICSPVGAYYPEGLHPVKIMVEPEYVRAVRGGTGYAKTGGNYAATMVAAVEAKHRDFTDVLWLDGVEHKYVEEVGAMNIFFKIAGKLITPQLRGSILPGITRMSCIELLRSWGLEVEERPIAIEEVYEAHQKGELEEVFGTGTACVISPVGVLDWKGHEMVIHHNEIGPLSQKLYDQLTGIQWGRLPDPYGWVEKV